MSDTNPDKPQTKKKLHLNKETLKDLSASDSAAKKAMGGNIGLPPATATCASCTPACQVKAGTVPPPRP